MGVVLVFCDGGSREGGAPARVRRGDAEEHTGAGGCPCTRPPIPECCNGPHL